VVPISLNADLLQDLIALKTRVDIVLLPGEAHFEIHSAR